MRVRRWMTGLVGVATLFLCMGTAHAVTVTMNLVDSFARSAPFGLAFDGTNIWWSQTSGTINEMTTAGVDTGNTTTNPSGWSALAWSGSQLVGASGHTITLFDKITAGNQSTITVTSSATGLNLIDGLDYDHGNIWYSPDVGNVYKLTTAGAFDGANPVLGGAGGFSGVERVDIGGSSFLIVVNDSSSPRRLDLRKIDGTLIGQTSFSNQRYEDLAFDGRYLYAADYYGNKIDKIDLLVDGQSIFGVPEPGTLILLGMGMIGLVSCRRWKVSS